MTWATKQHMERLYLDREGQDDVYVDIFPLPQHQIDGVRFLFRQFKKKKPGVILCNPEGYGKTLQVTLFLETARKLLDNPILILCENDNVVENWMRNLRKWTNYKEDDIVLDSPHVYVKKLIFLKKGTHLSPPYIRRDWGMVIFKNDFVPKEIIKSQIKASYKIWLTTIDMRKDLDMFNLIYSWLYTEKKFNVDRFLDAIPNSMRPLNRMKLLSSFMDDVVIIRNEFQPIMKPEIMHDSLNAIPRVSRKNKDATGTKIKRSKKKVVADSCVAVTDNTIANATSKPNDTITTTNIDEKENGNILVSECNITDKYKKDEVETKKADEMDAVKTEDMDVETFIRNRKPIECKEYECINVDNCTDANSQDLNFAEAVKEIVRSENDRAVSDENNCESVDSSKNNDGVNLSHPSEQLTHIDEKLSGDVDVACTNKEPCIDKEVIPLSVNVTNKDNDHNVVGEHNNYTCQDQKTENGDKDKLEIERQVKENSKRNIEHKISEMEEKTMKKFKGSLLDSFF